jgi:hypothetical protein
MGERLSAHHVLRLSRVGVNQSYCMEMSVQDILICPKYSDFSAALAAAFFTNHLDEFVPASLITGLRAQIHCRP